MPVVKSLTPPNDTITSLLLEPTNESLNGVPVYILAFLSPEGIFTPYSFKTSAIVASESPPPIYGKLAIFVVFKISESFVPPILIVSPLCWNSIIFASTESSLMVTFE